MADNSDSRLGVRRGARALAWLLAGCAAALPLGACQPPPAKPPVGGTTQPVTPVGPGATTREVVEVVREKIVYVDRPATPVDEVMAIVGAEAAKQEIKFSDIREPLLKGYGLQVLLNVVQLKLAKAEAGRRGLTVDAKDVQDEINLTLAQMMPDADVSQYPELLNQLLTRQRLQRSDFDIVMEINANLRKIAGTMIAPEVPEATLLEYFNATYGETVRVRHIACSNLQEVAEAQKRIAAGTAFETVARDLSRSRTANLGGELPPFSRSASDLSPAFKDMAFSLKEGEVSDPVQAESYYHLIKLEKRIAPRAVKFEDVKETLKLDLRKKSIDAAVKQFREALGSQARATLKVTDKTLDDQYQALIKAAAEKAAATPADAAGKANAR